MVESRVGVSALDAVLGDLEEGLYLLDCGDEDIPRIRELIRRYTNLALGYTAASVIACAERLRSPVFTFDRRHFDVVAGEGAFSIVP